MTTSSETQAVPDSRELLQRASELLLETDSIGDDLAGDVTFGMSNPDGKTFIDRSAGVSQALQVTETVLFELLQRNSTYPANEDGLSPAQMELLAGLLDDESRESVNPQTLAQLLKVIQSAREKLLQRVREEMSQE